MNNNRIPVTIITGFLGSGKTTLLNNLIKKYPNKNFAIIENEVGEMGIDGGLIMGLKDTVFELANGCICCSLNNDFQKTLLDLLNGPWDINHLLIETTGIADPDTIIKPFFSSPFIRIHFELDSVIGLADAKNLDETLDEHPEVRKQLSLSDIVLLNKTDIVEKEYVDTLSGMMTAINPAARIFPVTYSDISSIDILDTFCYSDKSIEKTTLSYDSLKIVKAEVNNKDSFVELRSNDHIHDIKTEGFIIPGSLDYDKFMFWMRNYIFFNGKNTYRIKGIISFAGKDEQYIFHSIRSDYVLEEGRAWNDDTRFSKIIFIGKKIDRDSIEDHLYQLISEV